VAEGRKRGIYLLLLHLRGPRSIEVGRLGRREFRAGWYLYVGSGMGGVLGRIRRHLRKGKRLRWHIDYLTEVAEVKEVFVKEAEKGEECAVARSLEGELQVIEGFGSSDCRCRGHLFYHPYGEHLRQVSIRALGGGESLKPEEVV